MPVRQRCLQLGTYRVCGDRGALHLAFPQEPLNFAVWNGFGFPDRKPRIAQPDTRDKRD
jgi:hypothetical protein